MKLLVVEMSDGKRWAIPALLVAKDRAAYYAKLDSEQGDDDYDTIYKEELDYTLSDDYELIDWAHNNMNWSDVSEHAILVYTEKRSANYEKEWINAPMSVEEREM